MRVDVRIVAATNEDLPHRVEKGTFRADLLDRLSFEVVTLPPLRARAGDVLVLGEFFGRRMAAELGRDWEGFGPTALDALTTHDWPGNVRELRNVVERAVYRWDRSGPVDAIQIDPFASPHRPRPMPHGIPGNAAPVQLTTEEPGPLPRGEDDLSGDFKSRVNRFERELLSRALSENRFNQRATAEALGLSYDQLRHALKRHDLLNAGG